MVSPTDTADTNTPLEAGLGAEVEADSAEIQPDINLDSLRERVSTVGREASLQADLTAIKRAAGHIPGLQSRLDGVEKAAKRVESLEAENRQLATQVNSLVNALSEAGLLTQGQVQGLISRSSDSNTELLAKVAELEERVTRGNEPQQPADVDPEVARAYAEWNAASEIVFDYARTKGFTGDIPDAVWERAVQAHANDINAAVLEVAKYVDSQTAAQARRDERKDAAAGGSGERATRRGNVTREQLANMSLADVMKIPAEERERIAAGG